MGSSGDCGSSSDVMMMVVDEAAAAAVRVECPEPVSQSVSSVFCCEQSSSQLSFDEGIAEQHQRLDFGGGGVDKVEEEEDAEEGEEYVDVEIRDDDDNGGDDDDYYYGNNVDRLQEVLLYRQTPADQMVHNTLPTPLIYGFSTPDQPLSAALVRLLLLRAGVEPNPGPLRWPCTSCGKSAMYDSVECSRCRNWVHRETTCSNLVNLADYTPASYICPSCGRNAAARRSTNAGRDTGSGGGLLFLIKQDVTFKSHLTSSPTHDPHL